MMNFFKMYLKERMKYILLTVMLIGLFSFTLLLMNVPAKALLYPVLLCLFLGLLVLVTDCAIAKSRKNERANLDKITLSVIDSMPEAHSEEVRDYQNAIRRLGNEYRNYVSESERKYENMMDYYTVWAHQIKTPISSMKLAFQGEDSTLSRRLSVDLFRIEQYVDMVLVYLRLDSEYTDYVFKECNMDEVIKNSVKNLPPNLSEGSFPSNMNLRTLRLSVIPSGWNSSSDRLFQTHSSTPKQEELRFISKNLRCW